MVLHACVVLAVLVLAKLNRLQLRITMVPILVLIPIWGAIAVLLDAFLRMRGKSGTQGAHLEAMRENQVESHLLPAPENEEGAVPLEDALLIDNAGMKRSVMMDVLMQDTMNYIPVLNEARQNDDVEVVHYATTAMVELSKEFELKIQNYATRYKEHPEEEGLLPEYRDLLQQYLYSGMVEGQMMEIHRRTYQQILRACIQAFHHKEDYLDLVESLFQTKDYSEIQSLLVYMVSKWPQEERLWKYRFRYYYENGNREGIQKLIQQVKEEGHYYSKDIRKMVDFWEKTYEEKTG